MTTVLAARRAAAASGRGDVERGSATSDDGKGGSAPMLRMPGANQLGCVCLLLVLLSLAPLAAYFGVFRNDVTSNNGGGGAGNGAGLFGGSSSAALPASADDDLQVRSRLWLKYVGRAPEVPASIVHKPMPVPGPLQQLLAKRERYERGPSCVVDRARCRNSDAPLARALLASIVATLR